jgi:hypothetical protein
VLALFFLEFIAEFWPVAASVRWLSPFHFFKPVAAVMGPGTPPRNPAVLAGVAMAFAAAAVVRFRRQDV